MTDIQQKVLQYLGDPNRSDSVQHLQNLNSLFFFDKSYNKYNKSDRIAILERYLTELEGGFYKNVSACSDGINRARKFFGLEVVHKLKVGDVNPSLEQLAAAPEGTLLYTPVTPSGKYDENYRTKSADEFWNGTRIGSSRHSSGQINHIIKVNGYTYTVVYVPEYKR